MLDGQQALAERTDRRRIVVGESVAAGIAALPDARGVGHQRGSEVTRSMRVPVVSMRAVRTVAVTPARA
jgi:hypothetical protein